jgi:hypothetical protein
LGTFGKCDFAYGGLIFATPELFIMGMRVDAMMIHATCGWLMGQIAAMLISSGTGMALERGVGEYRGFALLAIPMTGECQFARAYFIPRTICHCNA